MLARAIADRREIGADGSELSFITVRVLDAGRRGISGRDGQRLRAGPPPLLLVIPAKAGIQLSLST